MILPPQPDKELALWEDLKMDNILAGSCSLGMGSIISRSAIAYSILYLSIERQHHDSITTVIRMI